MLLSQLDHKPVSKRRGRALSATTNIAQALKLSFFQQLPKRTRQTINIARDIRQKLSYLPALTKYASYLRASSNPQTCHQSVRTTFLPSSLRTHTNALCNSTPCSARSRHTVGSQRRESLLQKMHPAQAPPERSRSRQRRSPNQKSAPRPRDHEDATRAGFPAGATEQESGAECRGQRREWRGGPGHGRFLNLVWRRDNAGG